MAPNKETIVYSIETKWDAKSKAQLEALQKESIETEKAVGNMGNSVQKAGKKTRASGYMIQNASYQIADFFVMLQGGISPVRALSTQLPQLLAGFGPFGAAAGAVAAVGASVWVAFDQMGESAEAASKELKRLEDALDALKSDDAKTGIQLYAAAIKDATEETKALAKELFFSGAIKSKENLAKANEELNDFIVTLQTAAEVNNNIGSFDGVLNIDETAKALQIIKDKFGATTDAVAQQIYDLNQQFRAGNLDVNLYLAALIKLGNANLIDDEMAKAIQLQAEALQKAQKAVAGYVEKLEEVVVQGKRLGTQEAIDIRGADEAAAKAKKYADGLYELKKAMALPISQGGLTVDEYAKRLKQLRDQTGALQEIKVPDAIAKTEEALQKFADTTASALDPMIAYTKQMGNLKLAQQSGRLTADQYTAAVKALNDEMLKEVVAPENTRLKGIKETGRALLETIEPVRAYNREVLEAKEALAAAGATAEQTAIALDKITDEYLQFVEVTAKRKPENPLENFDLVGFNGVIQDMKSSIEGFGDSFADSILDATESGMESFKEFADFVIKEIARIALKNLVIQPLVNSLSNLLPGAVAAPTPSLGVVETAGGSTAARTEAVNTSAITSGAMTAQPNASQKGINVNVNNYGNDEVEVQERKSSRGIEIDVLIKAAVNKGLASGDFDNAMRASYGSRRLAY